MSPIAFAPASSWPVIVALLGIVVLLVAVVRMLGERAARQRDRSTGVTQPPLPGNVAPSAAANAERRIVVILAAAVAATEGARARILDIRRVQGGNISSQQAWSMEGRREIYLSHRIR